MIEENKKENKALETSGATVVTPDVNWPIFSILDKVI